MKETPVVMDCFFEEKTLLLSILFGSACKLFTVVVVKFENGVTEMRYVLEYIVQRKEVGTITIQNAVSDVLS